MIDANMSFSIADSRLKLESIDLINLTVFELQYLCNPRSVSVLQGGRYAVSSPHRLISSSPLQNIGNLANKPRNQITPKIVWEHAHSVVRLGRGCDVINC
jgi:hypothetical protein